MTVSGFRSLKHKLSRMQRDLDRKPKQDVRRGMSMVRHRQRANLVEHNAMATMHLMQSFTRRETLAPGGHWRYEHKNTAAYAQYVEEGTGRYGPHPSPAMGPRLVAGLKAWALAKPTVAVDIKVLDAWAVSAAETISEKGTEAQPFFWPAWERTKPFIMFEVRNSVRDAVRR